MKIEIDLSAAIAAALAPEKLQPVLEKALNGAVADAINSATGYNSAFRKTLCDQLTEALPHGLDADETVKFQHVLNAAMNSALRDFNGATVQTAINRVLSDAMPDVPARLKLSELLELAREGFLKEQHEAFFAALESQSHGYYTLALDSDEDHSRSGMHRAAVFMQINGEGEVFALRQRGEDMTPSSKPTVIGQFDAALVALYVGRTRLDMDIDADEVKSLAQAQYD